MRGLRWWPVDEQFRCQKCDGKLLIRSEVHFAANGQLQFTGYCRTCRMDTKYEPYGTTLLRTALLNDLEEDRKEARRAKRWFGFAPDPASLGETYRGVGSEI